MNNGYVSIAWIVSVVAPDGVADNLFEYCINAERICHSFGAVASASAYKWPDVSPTYPVSTRLP
jgi:predicted methyltransferase MtxX (methanogen marker protein 4)